MEPDPRLMPPGLAGYLQAQRDNAQRPVQEMQNMGAAMTLAGNMDAMRKKQAYEAAMSALPPDATPEQRLQASMPFMGPDAQAKLVSDAENRKAQREQMAQQYADRLKAQADALEEKKRQFDLKAASDAEKLAFEQQYKTERAANERMMQGLMLQLKKQGIELQSEKAVGARKEALQKGTQQLGTALERAGLNEGQAALQAVEDAMKKNPELAEYLSGPKSLLPDAVIPEEIRLGKQAFQKLFNITLKNRSGAAVTNQELDRLKAEFGAGTFKTKAQLEGAVQQARGILGGHYRGIASGFGSEVMNAYNDNLRELGGTPLLEPQGAPATPNSGQIKPAANVPPLPPGFKLN